MPPLQPLRLRRRGLSEVHRAAEDVEHAAVLVHAALGDQALVEALRVLAPQVRHVHDPELTQILREARAHAGNGLEVVGRAVNTLAGHESQGCLANAQVQLHGVEPSARTEAEAGTGAEPE